MVVIVLKDDGTYYETCAFAARYAGWETEYFLLNEDDEFERVFAYDQKSSKIKKRVFLYDVNKVDNDCIEDGQYYGHKRFVNDKKLLDRIRNGEKNIFSRDDMIYYESIKYSRGVDKIIDDAKSCEIIYNFTGGFHDAVITKYDYNDKNMTLKIELEGVWGIEKLFFTFEGVKKYNIEDDYKTFYFIEGSLFYENDDICFVNDECKCKADINEGWTFVYAKRLVVDFIFEK